MLQLLCNQCHRSFTRSKSNNYKNTIGVTERTYCSLACYNLAKTTKLEFNCANCNKICHRTPFQLSRVKNVFCTCSCAVQYNNLHKTKGYRRSKLEIYLEEWLTLTYPKLVILFNDKSAINSELDIYIPSLKLAFELNGIFHYEPIYGAEKLSQIQNNDGRKFQACLERGIELCILDTSGQKRFTTQSSDKFLNIICTIISAKSG